DRRPVAHVVADDVDFERAANGSDPQRAAHGVDILAAGLAGPAIALGRAARDGRAIVDHARAGLDVGIVRVEARIIVPLHVAVLIAVNAGNARINRIGDDGEIGAALEIAAPVLADGHFSVAAV